MILMVNMLGFFLGHYPDHFALSDSQRTLILQTMAFFIWLAGGAGVYTRIEQDAGAEGWSFADAVSNYIRLSLQMPLARSRKLIRAALLLRCHNLDGRLWRSGSYHRRRPRHCVSLLCRWNHYPSSHCLITVSCCSRTQPGEHCSEAYPA
jgi:hypothetical protein